MINPIRIKELKIKPERIRQFINEIEDQEVDINIEIIKDNACQKKSW